MSDYWTGDEWRWRAASHPIPTHPTIQVIEPKAVADKANPTLGFGFGREIPKKAPPPQQRARLSRKRRTR